MYVNALMQALIHVSFHLALRLQDLSTLLHRVFDGWIVSSSLFPCTKIYLFGLLLMDIWIISSFLALMKNSATF